MSNGNASIAEHNFYDLATICSATYNKKINYKAKDLKALGYTIVRKSGDDQSSSGFFAMLLEKDNKYIVAVQGRNPEQQKFLPWFMDHMGIFSLSFQKKPNQLIDLKKFITTIKSDLGIKIDILTGHSLGGALALLAGIKEKEAKIVTFDALGTSRIIKNYCAMHKDTACDPEEYAKQITNIVSDRNPISSSLKHLGKVKQLAIPIAKYDTISFGKVITCATRICNFMKSFKIFEEKIETVETMMLMLYISLQASRIDHNIDNIVGMFNKDGSTEVPCKEFSTYGGRGIKGIWSCSKKKEFWTKILDKMEKAFPSHELLAFKGWISGVLAVPLVELENPSGVDVAGDTDPNDTNF